MHTQTCNHLWFICSTRYAHVATQGRMCCVCGLVWTYVLITDDGTFYLYLHAPSYHSTSSTHPIICGLGLVLPRKRPPVAGPAALHVPAPCVRHPLGVADEYTQECGQHSPGEEQATEHPQHGVLNRLDVINPAYMGPSISSTVSYRVLMLWLG